MREKGKRRCGATALLLALVAGLLGASTVSAQDPCRDFIRAGVFLSGVDCKQRDNRGRVQSGDFCRGLFEPVETGR